MATNKRRAASGRVLQAESAASKIEHVKNTFAETFAKSKQMHARKIVCDDEFTAYLAFRFSVTEQTKADRSIGNRQKRFTK